MSTSNSALQIELLGSKTNENPYELYRTLRKHCPLYYSDELDAYVLSRYQDVSFALKSQDFTVKNYEFQSEPLHGKTFIQMDGAEHSRYRSIVAPSIRGKQLAENIFPIIRTIASQLYDEMLEQNQIDFAKQFAARFPILVIAGLLGLEKRDEVSFLQWYRNFVDFIADLGQTAEITQRAFQTKEEITNYLLPIIAERRLNPRTDLVSTMCSAEIDGVRMTDLEIKAFVSLLITAGGESTDKMLSTMLRNLLLHPDQLEAVRSDRKLINAAFVESMRYSPVTHRLMRITSKEVMVSGGIIPANAKVLLMLGAAQHDEEQFESPEQFNIFRNIEIDKSFTTSGGHVAFGGGRHFCVGSMLAKAEIEEAFNQLLDRTEDIKLIGELPKERGLFTRGINSLPLEIKLK